VAYLGVQPTIGQYRKLDDISSGFNGSTATFNLTVSGQAVTAGSAQQLLVSLGGVIQNPGTDYTVSTNTITFTTNPASGLDFFAILMGQPLNVGTPGDSTVTSAKLVDDLTLGGRTTVASSLGTVSALGNVSTNQTLDFDTANNFSMTLTGNITLNSPSNIAAGQAGIVVITQDGTGSRTMGFNTIWKFPGGTIPTLSTAGGSVDALVWYAESATRITAKMLLDVRNP
jgi:hypothetical protein